MAVRKIVLDDIEDCDKYKLIAIHSRLEDFHLAYILNQKLNIRLARKRTDIDFQNAHYPIFEFDDKNKLLIWQLVCNICKVEFGLENDDSSLFTQEKKSMRALNLIPEHKEVNYFLKITYQTNSFEEEDLIVNLLAIPQIITAYKVDATELKSKSNLIFN